MYKLIMLFLVITIVCSSCGTFNGICSDTEAGAGALRRLSQPAVDRMTSNRYNRALMDRQQRVDQAAELVLSDRRVPYAD